MKTQLSWKVGGQQGEGIESTGEIFSSALNQLGYYLYGFRVFASRIKGGHTNNKIRISTTPTQAISDETDILIAFDQETIDLNYQELTQDGIIIADAQFKPKMPEDNTTPFVILPITKVAKKLGSKLMKNMVTIGASSALIGIEPHQFNKMITEKFAAKGEAVIEANIKAVEEGYQLMKEAMSENDIVNTHSLAPITDPQQRLFMIGNHAIAFGALVAGCRLMSAYPITPASEIMEYLVKTLPEVGGAVVQTEDEIAAATMAIGSNFAGVRAMTASSGPGLSLMMEAIGLAGMTEQPVVIVDTQRGGPSTGLPTKTEQSDLMQMIFGTHGDIPKVVLAPYSAEDAFYLTAEAFNIADELQCPVIILTDLQLSLGKQTVERLSLDKIEVRRGKLVDPTQLDETSTQYFKRYEVTEDGISPRTLPGMKGGIHHVTGTEHSEYGLPIENPNNRQQQMDKRMRKLQQLTFDEPFVNHQIHDDADVLVIGFNSTYGAIVEACQRFENSELKINHIHLRQIYPLPLEEIHQAIERAKKVLVVEHNYFGQLSQLLLMNIDCHHKIDKLLKYDGTPFLPRDIEQKLLELGGKK